MAKILIADDENTIPPLLAAYLPDHEVVEIYFVDEAISEVKKTVFDLIVTDLDFKQSKDGIDVIKATIDSPNKTTPRLINTSLPRFSPDEKKFLEELNVKIVVGKPDIHPILREIRDKLERTMKI